jgi:hypothetical protein
MGYFLLHKNVGLEAASVGGLRADKPVPLASILEKVSLL